MHIHLPKPLHGWREFLGEVGIIVVGVLIALGAEQLIQNVEWRHKVETADKAMRWELLFDDGPQIYQRAAMHPCMVARLNAIREAVESDGSRQEVVARIGEYWLETLSFDSVAHASATASDITSHMPHDELQGFTEAYGMMPTMDRTNAQEAAELAKLRALKRTGGALSEAEASQVLQAVEALRNYNHLMWIAARWSLPIIRNLGELDRGRVARFMGAARTHYGSCVVDLSPDWPKGLPAAE